MPDASKPDRIVIDRREVEIRHHPHPVDGFWYIFAPETNQYFRKDARFYNATGGHLGSWPTEAEALAFAERHAQPADRESYEAWEQKEEMDVLSKARDEAGAIARDLRHASKPDRIVIDGREAEVVEEVNLFDERGWRIRGLKPMPSGVAQMPAYFDHRGQWREIGDIGAGSMIEWKSREAAERHAIGFARRTAQPALHVAGYDPGHPSGSKTVAQPARPAAEAVGGEMTPGVYYDPKGTPWIVSRRGVLWIAQRPNFDGPGVFTNYMPDFTGWHKAAPAAELESHPGSLQAAAEEIIACLGHGVFSRHGHAVSQIVGILARHKILARRPVASDQLRAEVESILPSSWYADRPFATRLQFLVDHWRKLCVAIEQAAKEAESYETESDQLRAELAAANERADELNREVEVHKQAIGVFGSRLERLGQRLTAATAAKEAAEQQVTQLTAAKNRPCVQAQKIAKEHERIAKALTSWYWSDQSLSGKKKDLLDGAAKSLIALEAERDNLKLVIANDCEAEELARTEAAKYLGEEARGNSDCVPGVVELVKMLGAEIVKLRGEREWLRLVAAMAIRERHIVNDDYSDTLFAHVANHEYFGPAVEMTFDADGIPVHTPELEAVLKVGRDAALASQEPEPAKDEPKWIGDLGLS